MRIAFLGLLAKYPSSRGTPLRILEMAKSVSGDNEVYLICSEAKDVEEENIKYVPLNIRNRRLYSTSLLFLFPSLFFMSLKLYRILRKIRPDIAHVHTHNSLMLSILPLKILGIPTIFDAHGSFVDEMIMLYGRETADVKMWKLVEPFLFKLPDKITVVTKALGEYVISKGVKNNKIVRIPGGVIADFFRTNTKSKPNWGIKESDYIVMYTGNFYAWQGIDMLISAAREVLQQIHNIKFVLVGDTNHEKYQNLVDNLGLSEYFVFVGPKRREEMPDILQVADILILPRPETKVTRYGFPSKLPEYMASGKPVIATDVGDHGLLIKDGVTGLLVPPHSGEIAKAILRLSQDRALRKELGSKARELVKGEYSWDIIGAKIVGIYQELVGRKRV